MQEILEVLKETAIDSIKLLPFLFITYLIMEYIEHKMNDKSKKTIKKAGKFGPIVGGIVGIIPQCGFSASATSLYATRVISLGTLIAVYLSTSDEMIPIFISESVPIYVILKIIGIKLVIGIIFGCLIDFCLNLKNKGKIEKQKIEDMCEHDHCHCDQKGIVKSAVKHTFNITIYIFIVTLMISSCVYFIGEDNISEFIGNNVFLGPILVSLIGLIPNCAASVIITNLYLQNIINMPCLISGLLTSAGVGLIILFKSNKNLKENISIVGLLYAIGMISGIILQIIL